MDRIQQAFIAIGLSIVLLLVGTLGYMTIEKWPFFDALYMTVITIATVGYGEVHVVSTTGRIFTVVLILLGVSFFLYVAGSTIQFLVEGRIRHVLGRRKLDKQIDHQQDHYILCGYGRMGRALGRLIRQRQQGVVAIEENEGRLPALNADGVLYLIGKANNKELLIKAGIHRARGFIAVVGTDADNVFLTLIARQLNPKLKIIARAIQNDTKETLIAAGADEVISPYDSGARLMAHAILRPTVLKFLEMAFADENTDIQVEEIAIQPESHLADKTVLEGGLRKGLNIIVIFIKKQNGSLVFNPGPDTLIQPNDTLVVVGGQDNIKSLGKLAAP